MIIEALFIAGVTLTQQQSDSVKPDTIIRLTGMTITATRSAKADLMEQVEALSLVMPSRNTRAAGAVAVDLVREATGVHVQQTSAGQGAVILRGLVGNQVLLLVDGIPLNNGTYRDGPGQYMATIDPETIERIEVIRGPASVMYGSDAQGGVVNLITRPHPEIAAEGIRFSGAASSADMGGRARLSAALASGSWRLSLGGTAQSVGDLRAGGGLGPQDPTGFDAFGGDAALTYERSPTHSFTLAAQQFEMRDVPRYDRYVTFRAPEPGRDYEHTFDPQTRQLAYARYVHTSDQEALSRLEVTASLSTQREARNRVRLNKGQRADTREHWDDRVYTPGASIVGFSMPTLFGRPFSLTWGGEFYHDQVSSSGYEEDLTTGARTDLVRQTAAGPAPTGNFPDGANADRMGVFLAAETEIDSRLIVTAGGRFSRFRNEADVGSAFGGLVENVSSDLTGQLGLVAVPAAEWRIAVRLAEGFRAPNLYDLTRVGPVPGGVSLPNPDARPERSASVDLSLRHFDANGAVYVTFYYTRIRDFIDRAPGTFAGDTLYPSITGERVFQGLNVGTARVRGVEAEAMRKLGSIDVRANVQYTHGEQDVAGGVTEPMSKIPPLSGTASLRWTGSPRGPWVEYLFRWATAQTRLGARDLRDSRIPEGGTPGYGVHGVRAGTTLASDLSVTAGLENLTDELYRTHASGVDGAGRHVWVGLSWVGGL